MAFRKQSEFRGDASPKTWLYGIAARLCLHHHRGSGRLRGFLGRLVREPVEHSEDRPDHAAERKEEISTVHRILEMLPFKQREVFVLYELERLDGEVIAAMIGIPIGTVWTRLHHGRKTFTRLMRRERLKEGGT